MKKVFSVFFFLLPSFAMAANDVLNTQTENTVSQNTIINSTHLGTAKDWNLTDVEWIKYLNLMQGPSGLYYKKLSPPEVLGIDAETKEELQYYAQIAAKLEHDKLERELRFNAAFHDAAAGIYTLEPIIHPFDYTPFLPIAKTK
jgi:integrating conjugative element protein (TIGR03759 family)